MKGTRLAALGVALLIVAGLVYGPGSRLGSPWVLPGLLALLGILLVLSWPRYASLGRLALLLLLLPTLAEFQYAGGRLKGDGVMYYVYVRSLVKDRDLDFTNEYAHYDLLSRGDLAMPTRTGLRRSIFAVGPGIASLPFFLVGEGFARLENARTGAADLSGYGPDHRNAVALGGLLYGFLGVLLVHDLLRRRFSGGLALGGALLVWLATFHYWYMVGEPTMSHAFSMAFAALAVWLWDRDRGRPAPGTTFLLGLALGFAMCTRWQNGVLLLLPLLDLLAGPKDRGAGERLLALSVGAFLGVLPQLAAWRAIYGDWVLTAPPHGEDFLRLSHPFFWNTFFSSRHGLLSWTPVLWGGYLGFLLFLKREPRTALPLLLPLVAMTYVNVCSGDWWAGGSFSNRRFDSLLPILALGLTAFLAEARAFLARRPGVLLPALSLPFVLWNLLLAEGVQKGLVPRDDTVSLPDLVGIEGHLLADRVGSPNTWPASLRFAAAEGRPPSQYDLLAGKYLFYRQNNLGGHIALGSPGDEAFAGEGLSPRETRDGIPGRRVLSRGRVLVPTDTPEPLGLVLRAEADRETPVRVLLNGHLVGTFAAGPGWTEARLETGAADWRREINDLVFEAPSEEMLLGPLDFLERRR
jgi:hypothetical protein